MKVIADGFKLPAMILGIIALVTVKVRGEEVKRPILQEVVSDWGMMAKKDATTQRKGEIVTMTGEGTKISLKLNCKKVFDRIGRGPGVRPGMIKFYKSVPESDGFRINISIFKDARGQGDSWDAIIFRKVANNSYFTQGLGWADDERFSGFLSKFDHLGQTLLVSGNIGKKVDVETRKRIGGMIQALSEKLLNPQVGAIFFEKFEDPSLPVTGKRKIPISPSGMRSVELNEAQISEVAKTGSFDTSALPLQFFFRPNQHLPKRLKVVKVFTRAEMKLAEELGGSIQCFWVSSNRFDIFSFPEK